MMVAVTILHIVISVALVVVVLLQTGKDPGLSGVISGSGAQDSFFGKNRSKSKDAVLARITTILAIIFIITSLALSILFKG